MWKVLYKSFVVPRMRDTGYSELLTGINLGIYEQKSEFTVLYRHVW